MLYVGGYAGPYPQLNPIKWLANIAGVALVIGSGIMIKSRLTNKEQVTTYKDWFILGVVFALGLSGMLTEMARLAEVAWLSYFFYWIHLIAIFNLFAFLPYSKNGPHCLPYGCHGLCRLRQQKIAFKLYS